MPNKFGAIERVEMRIKGVGQHLHFAQSTSYQAKIRRYVALANKKGTGFAMKPVPFLFIVEKPSTYCVGTNGFKSLGKLPARSVGRSILAALICSCNQV